MRKIKIERKTLETTISVELNLDEQKEISVQTGIGFFDHMLTLWAKHSGCGLVLKCSGDTHIDCHHTVEDCGIVLGKALAECLADKTGLNRYGEATIPMDEALLQAVVDISGRGYLVYNVDLLKYSLHGYDTEMTEEFFRAVAHNAGLTLHLRKHYGNNLHHIVEGLFKAFGRAMKVAIQKNGTDIPSTKGVL